jgi:hypothetical protein
MKLTTALQPIGNKSRFKQVAFSDTHYPEFAGSFFMLIGKFAFCQSEKASMFSALKPRFFRIETKIAARLLLRQ